MPPASIFSRRTSRHQGRPRPPRKPCGTRLPALWQDKHAASARRPCCAAFVTRLSSHKLRSTCRIRFAAFLRARQTLAAQAATPAAQAGRSTLRTSSAAPAAQARRYASYEQDVQPARRNFILDGKYSAAVVEWTPKSPKMHAHLFQTEKSCPSDAKSAPEWTQTALLGSTHSPRINLRAFLGFAVRFRRQGSGRFRLRSLLPMAGPWILQVRTSQNSRALDLSTCFQKRVPPRMDAIAGKRILQTLLPTRPSVDGDYAKAQPLLARPLQSA